MKVSEYFISFFSASYLFIIAINEWKNKKWHRNYEGIKQGTVKKETQN